ncbi:unnamed protein product [Protopolystoma xenopodis]|uniref:NR LBD domain-containing protein n=1 Tax=Protopolystoma xenopodis TaxID=117903 RepID=A0A448WAT9_9PLAT|nr:unnamed protein product [Protopolystoma xenopodis]
MNRQRVDLTLSGSLAKLSQGSIEFCKSLKPHLNCIPILPLQLSSLIRRHVRVRVRRSTRLQIDPVELDCLKAVLLFNSKSPGLRDSKKTAGFRERAQMVMAHHQNLQYPSQPNRYERSLLFLADLRNVAPKLVEEVFFDNQLTSADVEKLLASSRLIFEAGETQEEDGETTSKVDPKSKSEADRLIKDQSTDPSSRAWRHGRAESSAGQGKDLERHEDERSRLDVEDEAEGTIGGPCDRPVDRQYTRVYGGSRTANTTGLSSFLDIASNMCALPNNRLAAPLVASTSSKNSIIHMATTLEMV